MASYYYSLGNEAPNEGPFALDEMRRRVVSGEITKQTLVHKEGTTGKRAWRVAYSLSELEGAFIVAAERAPENIAAQVPGWGFSFWSIFFSAILSFAVPIVGWLGGLFYMLEPKKRPTGLLMFCLATGGFIIYMFWWMLSSR